MYVAILKFLDVGFQEVLKFEATWSQVFGGDGAIAGPPNPPFLSSFVGSQHSKHTSEILRCHRLISGTKLLLPVGSFRFLCWQLSKQNMSFFYIFHQPKNTPKKNKHEITPSKPNPPSTLSCTKKLAGCVCSPLWWDALMWLDSYCWRSIPFKVPLCAGGVELSWENGDVWPFFVGWLDSWWKPKLYEFLGKWCFCYRVQVQVRWGVGWWNRNPHPKKPTSLAPHPWCYQQGTRSWRSPRWAQKSIYKWGEISKYSL